MAIYRIKHYPWGGDYRPQAEAELTLKDHSLELTLRAWEQTIVAAESRVGGAVYKDSCMEFFFQPCPDSDPRYINIETNPLGVMHIGVGASRQGRAVLMSLPEGFEPRCGVQTGKAWFVLMDIPFDWIRSLFPGFDPKPGTIIRGNFYKCDESIHPHFGCWNPIETPQPDFHRPEYFGRIIL